MNIATSDTSDILKDSVMALSLIKFSATPLDYLHESWRYSLTYGSILDKLKNSQRAKPLLTHYLDNALALEPVLNSTLPSDNVTKILLLDGPIISRLALFAGIITDADRVKHTILKTELQALKTAIGESGYSFALKRAPFLGKVPEALSVSGLQADDYHEHFMLCGLRCLGLALSQVDSAILSRFVLKFPMAYKDSLTALPMSASHEDATQAQLLVNRLAAELELFDA